MGVRVGSRLLGVERNGVFTSANTDLIPGGRLWPEAALTWNAMRAAYVADGGHPDDMVPAGPNSSARTLAAQERFWAIYQRDGSPVAAVPGTSNHGWGIAVDVRTRVAQAWILRHGGEFGWSHDEGARVGEWWHDRYVGASSFFLRKLRDPLAGYTSSERRWIREYDRLVKARRDPGRQRVLRRVMSEQRKRIWRVAQPRSAGGDGKGWTVLRRRRYRSLLARTS